MNKSKIKEKFENSESKLVQILNQKLKIKEYLNYYKVN
jgi:hypothetical protein